MEKEGSLTLLISLEDFCTFIASEKGLALATIEAYKRDLQLFLNFLESSLVISWKAVTHDHLLRFLSLKKADYAASSIARFIVALKVFFRFLKREEIIEVNPFKLLELPKVWKRLPDVPSRQEMEEILTPIDLMAETVLKFAILELLYSSGLRVSELCFLKISDFGNSFLRVQGKGGKQRMVPVGNHALEILNVYLKNERSLADRDDFLFVGPKGKKISRQDVWKIVKEHTKQVGCTKNIHPHTFRHAFATHLLEGGADLRVIQELLGHASIDNTDRYTHVEKSKMQEAFNAFHPRP